MKKIIILIMLAVLLAVSPISAVFSATTLSKTSGEVTADGIIHVGKCAIASVLVITDGTNDARVILYDNASAALGTVIAEITITGADNYGGRNWEFPVECVNGLYADLNGTGASVIVEYLYR